MTKEEKEGIIITERIDILEKAKDIPVRLDIITEYDDGLQQGKAKRTIEQNYRKAAKQSKFIIFDLRRCPIPESQSLGQLQREFTDRHTKRLLVILKNGSLQEYPQK